MAFGDKLRSAFKSGGKSNNFKYLHELIQNGGTRIVLDTNITLEKEELSEYKNGIRLNRNNIVIDGADHTIDAKGKARIFSNYGNNVTLKNIKFVNGFAEDGGAIANYGELKIEGSEFNKNKGETSSGAIYNDKDAVLKITDTSFNENSAGDGGGSIASFGNMTITDCKFDKNKARDAGALFNDVTGVLELNNTTFTQNQAKLNGGALANFGTMTSNDSKFIENISKHDAGAISNQKNGNLKINNNKFIKNKSSIEVGAIANLGNLEAENCTFCENESKNTGAIIFKIGSSGEVSNSTFKKQLSREGTCINNQSEDIKIINCKFIDNTAKDNIIVNSKTLQLLECTFKENKSNLYIILNEAGSTLNISNGEIIENSTHRSTIMNNGETNIDGTVIENRTTRKECYADIINKNKFNLNDPQFKNDEKTVINYGHMDIKKMESEEIKRKIENLGTIDEYKPPSSNEFDFSYLHDLIHELKDSPNYFDEQLVLNLDVDICLETYEYDFFGGGLELDCDGLIINGNDHTIDGNSKTRIFNVTGKDITIKNVIFKNGACLNKYDEHTTGGGAIRITKGASLTLENCEFIDNTSEDDGGAIHNTGTLTSIHSTFINNTSPFNGGAIHNMNTLTLENDEFQKNKSRMGSAIYNNGELTINDDITLRRNRSHIRQGIYNANSIKTNIDKPLERIVYNTGHINAAKSVGETFSDLNDRIAISNEITLNDNITFNYKKDKQFKNGIDINKDVTINGNNFSIDGESIASLFKISRGRVVLRDITFRNCQSRDHAMIENNGDLRFERCKFLNNTSTIGNFLIDNEDYLEIVDCDFANNSAKNKSMIFNKGTLDILDSRFINNYTKSDGNIYNTKKATLKNSNFHSNYSKKNGGAVFNSQIGELTIEKCEFTKNYSGIEGGAIHSVNTTTITDSNFINNITETNGGAINHIHDKLTVTGGEFVDNDAKLRGGAIYTAASISLEKVMFKNNRAGKKGGAVGGTPKFLLDKTDCTFIHNTPNDVSGR